MPNFWNRVQAYVNDRLPKGALANKDIATIEDGGTNATTAKDARVNLGITYGTEVPTETPATGSGAVYFFEDVYTPVSIVEGGTGANTAEGAITNLGIADYVVEEGTSGNWAYRKWASGIAECWGRHTFSTAHYNTVNSFYGYYNDIYFPFTFATTPIVTWNCQIGSGFSLPGSANYTYTNYVRLYALCNASGTLTCIYDVHVKGKWK